MISNNNLTLSENFQKGAGPTLDFQGATQNGYGPEMWGLTLNQIKAICEYPKIKSDTTMRQVVELAIKPLTKNLGIGYALLVNQHKPLRAKVMVSVSYYSNDNTNPIDLFFFYSARPFANTIHILFYSFVYISSHNLQHAWEEPIDHFITCLERSGEEGPFWVCAFSIFQSQGDDDKPTIAEQLGPDPEFGPFATVLKQANVMVAVVTIMCNIYTRLW